MDQAANTITFEAATSDVFTTITTNPATMTLTISSDLYGSDIAPATETFTVTIVELCETAVISFTQLANVVLEVNQGAHQRTISPTCDHDLIRGIDWCQTNCGVFTYTHQALDSAHRSVLAGHYDTNVITESYPSGTHTFTVDYDSTSPDDLLVANFPVNPLTFEISVAFANPLYASRTVTKQYTVEIIDVCESAVITFA